MVTSRRFPRRAQNLETNKSWAVFHDRIATAGSLLLQVLYGVNNGTNMSNRKQAVSRRRRASASDLFWILMMAGVGASSLIICCCWLLALPVVESWTFSTVMQSTRSSFSQRQRQSSSSSSSIMELSGVSKSQLAVLDGAEWVSLQRALLSRKDEPAKKKKKRPSQVGYLTVVTGTDEDNSNQRVVGIQADDASSIDDRETVKLSDTVQIYKDSMALIRNERISDATAISTLIASLTSVHCALPQVMSVGGSSDNIVSGTAVVMGGSDYACFAAEGLAAMGAKVYVVSTNKPKLKNKEIQVLTPAVGDMELGFSAYIGEFDSLVDTLGDESRGKLLLATDDDDDELYRSRGGTLEELRTQHGCRRYVSTMSMSQRIVRDKGVLFGPKEADRHVMDVTKAVRSQRFEEGNDYEPIIPPSEFGTTLQTLLDHDIAYRSMKVSNNDVMMRGWTLKDFWEDTTWPQDSAAASVRFGLPVRAEFTSLLFDDDDDDEPTAMMISDPSEYLRERFDMKQGITRKQLEANEKAATDANPFVTNIDGVEGLQLDIVQPERDCLLFLSAPFCRTCKSLSPKYTRMAREHLNNNSNNEQQTSLSLMFAKANAVGRKGKLLGKALCVDAVPSFVLFRQGKVYGTPLGVTRLPSYKLNRALEYMQQGKDWDSSVLLKEEEDEDFSSDRKKQR